MTSYAVVLAPEGAKDGLSRLMRTLKLKSTQIKRILLNLRKRKPDVQMTMRMRINHMIPNTDTRAVDGPGFRRRGHQCRRDELLERLRKIQDPWILDILRTLKAKIVYSIEGFSK